MIGLTDYAANKYLDHLFQRSNDVDFGTAVWAALSTTTPVKAGTNFTEPVGEGYARVLIGYYGQSATYKFPAADLGATANDDAIHFPLCYNGADADWGVCTHLGLFDSETGGNLLFTEALTSSIHPVEGKVPVVNSGSFTASLN